MPTEAEVTAAKAALPTIKDVLDGVVVTQFDSHRGEVDQTPAAPPSMPRTRNERESISQFLVAFLKQHGSISSFEAQKLLNWKGQPWAPGTLRTIFRNLEEEGLVYKEGQKRSLRYHLKKD